MRPWLLKHILNIWPPYLGAGIRVKHIAPDFSTVDVEMKLRWFNRNYVGTHFGGSLFALTDPFYMLILMHKLGRRYIVWDKAASIEFKKPGKGKVHAHFEFSAAEIEFVQQQADALGKYVFEKPVHIRNEAQETIAIVHKTLYVKRKSS